MLHLHVLRLWGVRLMISQIDINDMASVIVYTSPSCQPCKATKRFLTEKGIPFEERDVTASQEAAAAVAALGYRGLPVIVHGDQHWQGLVPSRLNALVG